MSAAAAREQYNGYHRRVMDLTQLIKRFSTGTMTAARKRTTLGDAELAMINRSSMAKRRLKGSLSVWEWKTDSGAFCLFPTERAPRESFVDSLPASPPSSSSLSLSTLSPSIHPRAASRAAEEEHAELVRLAAGGSPRPSTPASGESASPKAGVLRKLLNFASDAAVAVLSAAPPAGETSMQEAFRRAAEPAATGGASGAEEYAERSTVWKSFTGQDAGLLEKEWIDLTGSRAGVERKQRDTCVGLLPLPCSLSLSCFSLLTS
jgi:hypothetical protein